VGVVVLCAVVSMVSMVVCCVVRGAVVSVCVVIVSVLWLLVVGSCEEKAVVGSCEEKAVVVCVVKSEVRLVVSCTVEVCSFKSFCRP